MELPGGKRTRGRFYGLHSCPFFTQHPGEAGEGDSFTCAHLPASARFLSLASISLFCLSVFIVYPYRYSIRTLAKLIAKGASHMIPGPLACGDPTFKSPLLLLFYVLLSINESINHQ